MSTELTYKLNRPDDGDKGSSFFDDLENNITALDAHDHSGSTGSTYTGKPLATLAFNNTYENIGTITTSVAGKDLYEKTVTLPSGLTMPVAAPQRGIFFVDDSHNYYNLTVERVSDTQYKVYCNDNTITFYAIYV